MSDPTQRSKRGREDPSSSSSLQAPPLVVPTNTTTTTAPSGGAEDATDRVFRSITTMLEGEDVGIFQWSSENKNKLSEMLSMYLTFRGGAGTSEGGNDSSCGEESDAQSATSSLIARKKAARQAQVPDAKQFAKSKQSDRHLKDTGAKMMLTLSIAKDVIKNLVPPTDVDTKAKAPTYEEDIRTFEIDGFLYEDEEEVDDQLVDPGYISRNYCSKCGEHQFIVPTRFISHSFTRHQLTYLFNHVVPRFVLPQLEEKVGANNSSDSGSSRELNFLDIGSRFGVVPIAASCVLKESSGWKGIRGIELNKKYCDLSKVALQKIESRASVGEGQMEKGRQTTREKIFFPDGTQSTSSLSRIEFVNKDALGDDGGLDLMSQADLLCFNNVFEWYTDTTELLNAWKKVRTATMSGSGVSGSSSGSTSTTRKKKKYLITNPSLEESLAPLFGGAAAGGNDDGSLPAEVSVFLEEWGVKEIDLATIGLHFTRCFFEPDAEVPDDEQIEPLHLYELSL